MNAELDGRSPNVRRALAAAASHAPRVFVGVPLGKREARVMIKRVIEGGHEGVALVCGARRGNGVRGLGAQGGPEREVEVGRSVNGDEPLEGARAISSSLNTQ